MSRNQTNRRVDAIRAQSSELENHLIDEYSSGRLSRRDFVRRGTVIGMSLSAVGFLASACGTGKKTSTGEGGGGTAVEGRWQGGRGRAGGTMSSACPTPGDRSTRSSFRRGRPGIMSQTGEYLSSDGNLELQPRLAESWEPNADGTVWTFKIRQGVTFNDGTPMTAKDVAATIDRLGPRRTSRTRSPFKGVLVEGRRRRSTTRRSVFKLDAPNGNFPYLVSSDNYNAIILPEEYDGDFEKTFIGTGPWKLEKFTPNSGASSSRTPTTGASSRSRSRPPSSRSIPRQAQVLALQGGQVDVLVHFSVDRRPRAARRPGGHADRAAVGAPPDAHAHRQGAVRGQARTPGDGAPRPPGARRRPLPGKAVLGNDSPFAPVFPSTDPTVAQRGRTSTRPRRCSPRPAWPTASGRARHAGRLEMPDLAQLDPERRGRGSGSR